MADPVIEQTSTTTTTANTEASAAKVLAPPPAVVADDYIRKVVVCVDSVVFLIMVGGICGYLIYHKGTVGTDVLAVLIMVVQAMIQIIYTERQYLFGGSSGSTAKTAAVLGKP